MLEDTSDVNAHNAHVRWQVEADPMEHGEEETFHPYDRQLATSWGAAPEDGVEDECEDVSATWEEWEEEDEKWAEWEDTQDLEPEASVQPYQGKGRPW